MRSSVRRVNDGRDSAFFSGAKLNFGIYGEVYYFFVIGWGIVVVFFIMSRGLGNKTEILKKA